MERAGVVVVAVVAERLMAWVTVLVEWVAVEKAMVVEERVVVVEERAMVVEERAMVVEERAVVVKERVVVVRVEQNQLEMSSYRSHFCQATTLLDNTSRDNCLDDLARH